MSDHKNGLLNIQDEAVDGDEKTRSPCARLFKCCGRRKTKRKDKGDHKLYPLKEKETLLEKQNSSTSPGNSVDVNQLCKQRPFNDSPNDQIKIIESQGRQQVDEHNVLLLEDDKITIQTHPTDVDAVDSKSHIQYHATNSKNKLEKPQDNSLKSFTDIKENSKLLIKQGEPNNAFQQRVDDVPSSDTNLLNETSTCFNSQLISPRSADLNNKQLPQSSNSVNTDNQRNNLTLQVDHANAQTKRTDGLTNGNPNKISQSGNLILRSGEGDLEACTLEAEGRRSVGGENILLESNFASATTVRDVRSSTTSEVIEYKYLHDITLDVDHGEGGTPDNHIVKKSPSQATGVDKSFEHLPSVCEDVLANPCESVVHENNQPSLVENINLETCVAEVGCDQELRESTEEGLRTAPEGREGCTDDPHPHSEREVRDNENTMSNYYSFVADPLLYTQSDLDEVVKAREDEWHKRQEQLESKVKEEIAMRELLEQDHRSKTESLKKDNSDMKTVVSQYEKTIVELTEHNHSRPIIHEDTLSETVRAKDQLHHDLNTAEANLVDAYKRIEKLKLAVDSYKENEDRLKGSLDESQCKLQKSEERYVKLKHHASEKIDAANVEIERVRKQKEIDLAGLQAALKKAQNRVTNLEVEIQQKSHENKELSQICDELIKKVSGE